MPKFCPSCGTPLPEGVKFCPGCGHNVAAEAAPQPQQSYAPPAQPSAQGAFSQSFPNPAPQQSNPQPQQSNPQPQQSIPQPQQAYRQAPQGFQQPQQGYQQPPQGGYQQPQQGYRQPQYQAPYGQPQQSWGQPPKKSKAPLIIAIVAVLVLGLAAVACFVWPGFLKSDEPAKPGTSSNPTEPASTKPGKPKPAATTEAPTEAPVTTTEEPVISNPFTNVEEWEFDYDELLWCYTKGVYTETTIDRELPLTRGEVITMLWKAVGSPAPKADKHGFTDVSTGMECNTPLIWLEESRIFTSAATTEFKPDEVCTRGTALYFLYKYSGEDASGYTRAFVDTKQGVNEYTISNWGFNRGLVERDDDYRFNAGNDMLLGDWLCWLARQQEPLYSLYPMTLSFDGFEDYGMTEYVNNVEAEMEFVSVTKEDDSIFKRLKITVEDYQIFDEADGYEAREGYEWRVATILIGYAEADAEDYSYSLYAGFYDYYNMGLFRDNTESLEEGEGSSSYIVYNGELRDVTIRPLQYEVVDGALFRIVEAIQVPWDYDGAVVVVNGKNGQPSGDQSLDDVYDTGEYHAFFRME